MIHERDSTVQPETGDGQNLDPLLTARDAAAYLSLTTDVVRDPAQTIRSLIRRKKLRGTTVAAKVMTRVSWLEQYIADNEGKLARKGTPGRRRRRRKGRAA